MTSFANDSHFFTMNDSQESEFNKLMHVRDTCDYLNAIDRLKLHNFSVLHMNVRSMKNKKDEIDNFLLRLDIPWDAICISETWLKDDIVNLFQIDGYNCFASCRQKGEGGGTAIYVHEKHDVIERRDLESTEFETTFLQLNLKTKELSKVIVGEIYRPPASVNATFLSYMEKVLDVIENEKKIAVIAGDFNYDLLPIFEKDGSNDFSNLLTAYGFFPLISRATRKHKEVSSLLDNIFINDFQLYHSSGVIIEDLSDHFPVFASLKIGNPCKIGRESVTVFDKRRMNELSNILNMKLEGFQENTDVNIASEILAEAYREGIQLLSKTFTPSRRKTSIKPWITPSILCSINRKNDLYNKYMRRRNLDNENKYKQYRNILVQTIRTAKTMYFRSELHKNKDNGKRTWELINQVTNKPKSKKMIFPDNFADDRGKNVNKSGLADGFNDFFSSIGQVLEKEIPKVDKDPISYLNEVDVSSNAMPRVTCNQIENIIKSLNRVGGGIDNISTDILLGTYKNILHHLTFFFNLCLEHGCFPNNLKVSIITPIFKSGKKDTFTNYRPISLLPILSKVLEKIMYESLSSFLEEHNVLNPLQFGFRKKHSTYMPIAHMYEEITKQMEMKEVTCTIYLDLKKAFDTVSFEILLRKLSFIGVRGNLFEIIKSYLSSRCQITKVNNMYSKKRDVVVGVPQGSILGPLLFIIYINDIVRVTETAKFYLFADDTAVMFTAKNTCELQAKANVIMPALSEWFQANRLSINASKTYYQIYSSNQQTDIDIYIDQTRIERKGCVRYLGIYIDENLKWNSHIAYVVKTISRNLGIMGRAKHYLSARELILLYNGLILPHLNYCAVIWGRTYPSNLKKVSVLQKRAMRIIDKKPYLYPTNDLFIKYKILKFPDMVREQNMMILLAHLNHTLPKPISDMFKHQEASNTRQHKHFVIPNATTNYRLFSLACSAPRIWRDVIGPVYKSLNDVPRSKTLVKKCVRNIFMEEYKKLNDVRN